MIIFGPVQFLYKKITKPNIFFKKTEIGSNRPVSVRFFRTKTGSNRFGSFFQFGTVLAHFFLVWLGFFSGFFRFGFGFFDFRLVKPKPNRIGRFFQNFNQFFFTVRFFRLFFFLVFSVFLLTATRDNCVSDI